MEFNESIKKFLPFDAVTELDFGFPFEAFLIADYINSKISKRVDAKIDSFRLDKLLGEYSTLDSLNMLDAIVKAENIISDKGEDIIGLDHSWDESIEPVCFAE